MIGVLLRSISEHSKGRGLAPKGASLCEALAERSAVYCIEPRQQHGKGAALFARQQRGAIYGQGEGLQGNSYAIPTRGQRPDRVLYTLPLEQIRAGVDRFLAFAVSRPDLRFEVTPVGYEHAGYRPVEIAPMFEDAPANCQLPGEVLAHLAGPVRRVTVPAIRFPRRAGS